MVRVALKGLAGRKLRSALTAVAIVLGVAMISGTYVLTDTIKNAFDTIFVSSYKNTDAVISGKVAFTSNQNNNASGTPAFPASLLARVQRLPDVRAAAGSIADMAKFVGRNGKTISSGGAPGLAFSVQPGANQQFNPTQLTAGSWPNGPDEVAIDKSTADKHHYKVGDTIGVAARGPVKTFRISGIAKFAGVSSIGGATFAIFDLPTAQKLFNKVGKLDAIRVAGKPGVSQKTLVAEITPLLPQTAQVRSTEAQVKQDEKGLAFIGVLQKALLAFAGVALFVGSFVIANTLSITIAQRTREFATLKTLGATRRQVLWSVLLEALAIGVMASLLGLFAGLGLAKALNAVFVAIGVDLPKSSTIFAGRTVAVSLIVGIVITLVASMRPAFRATRVPPIAAVREGAMLPPSRFARFAPVSGVAVSGVGVLLVAIGAFAKGLSTVQHLVSLGAGALMIFIGVAIFAPTLVRPLASVLGWPGTRLGGAAGKLARENAIRNPSRTASTAAALMIGLALVTFVSVFAAGLRGGFEGAVNKLFVGDYALTSSNGFDPLTAQASEALRKAPGVTVVSPIRAGSGRLLGKTINVTAVEPSITKVIALDWTKGSAATPGQLGRDGVFISKKYAKDHHLTVGSPVALEVPSGRVLNLRVKGIFDPPTGGSPFGTVTISEALFDSVYPSPTDLMTLVDVRGGVSPASTKALESALKGFPDAKVQTQSQFKKNQEKGINSILSLLYVLLALSVVISLFGIVNTLVLTVFERTRELGMLRAVGMTRRQVRRMIRYESIVTSLIGGVLGIVIGIFLGLLIIRALKDQGLVYTLPWGSLAVFVLATIVVGIVAAVFPARRAARLNVLQALQYE